MKEPGNEPQIDKDISQEKKEELASMKVRIEKALGDESIREDVANDFIHTFEQVGLSRQDSKQLVATIFEKLLASTRLDHIEQDVLHDFEKIQIGEDGKNIIDVLHEKLRDRAVIIYNQISPELDGVQGKVVDFGAGDGQVTQKLKNWKGLDVQGFDVREYRAPGVTVTIEKFDGAHTGVSDGDFSAGVMTNVAHHEKDNQKIIDELTRIIKPGGRLVVLETVPVGKDEEEIKKDRERTFMNDYLYNRLFHNADVPVPGTYETPEGWIRRFEEKGWRLVRSEDLGYDQPTIRDVHHLLVFERI